MEEGDGNVGGMGEGRAFPLVVSFITPISLGAAGILATGRCMALKDSSFHT